VTAERNGRARTRTSWAAGTLFVPLLTVVVSWALWREVLPHNVASHWSDLGAADDSLPTQVVLLIAVIVTALAALTGLVVVLLPRVQAATTRGLFLIAGFLAGLFAGLWLVSTALTLQAGSASAAVLGGWILAPLAMACFGFVPYAIAPKPVLTSTDTTKRITLTSSDARTWSRTITGTVFLWAALIVATVGAVLYGGDLIAGQGSGRLFGAGIFTALTVLLASFTRLRVTVDERGFRIVSSLLQIPLKRIPLTRIETVDATVLRPQEWGGWGYRVMPGRSALIMHTGPGLVIGTIKGKLFAISLDDPEEPAALLATLRDGATGAVTAGLGG
jgi:hypothetical protein